MKRLLFLFLAIILIAFPACKVEEGKTFSVGCWNLYAFFDGRDDGSEFEEFRQKSGYTRARYEERIKATAAYIHKYMGDVDLLVLEEVESIDVLKDLLDAGLARYGWLWFGLAQSEEGSLSVGFLSRYRPEEVKVHGTGSSRLVLEVDLFIGGRNVSVYGIHARSRVSDVDGSQRTEEFSLLGHLLDSSEGSLAIALGDFNADPSVAEPGMALERQNRFSSVPLLITGDGGATRAGVYYSPSYDYMVDIGEGTYWYEGKWENLDHILIDHGGFDGDGWEYSSSRIVRPAVSTDYAGHPLKYDPSTGKGFSDHFALVATFRYN